MVGIDTNILVYAYDKGSPLYQKAKTLLNSLIYEDEIAISDLSLLEFYSVITDGRKVSHPLPSEIVLKITEHILRAKEFKVCGSNINILFKAFQNSHFYQKLRYAINDVYIATTLAEHGIFKILTRNVNDFKKFEFIQAINPFQDAWSMEQVRAWGQTLS